METLIRMSSALYSLNDNEFGQLIKSIGRKDLSCLIFNAFNFQLQNITTIDEIEKIISKIQQISNNVTEIIESRDDNKNDEYEVVDKFDKLPLVMISAVSSFMDYESITNLERCNRALFIGSRSPISLHTYPEIFNNYLKFCVNNDYQYIWQMYRFRLCKSLNISLANFFIWSDDGEYFYSAGDLYELTNLNHHWQNINSLTIQDGFRAKYEGPSDPTHYVYRFKEALASCNISNITSVRITGAYSRTNPFWTDILSALPNVQYAEFSQCLWNRNISKIEWPAALKGICMGKINSKFNEDSAQWHFGDHLESYHGLQGVASKMVQKLHNLKEICLAHDKNMYNQETTPFDDLKSLINGLPHLERMYYEDNISDIDENKERKTMLKSLWSGNNLNYISINCEANTFVSYLCMLNEVVMSYAKHKRRMKVQIRCYQMVDDVSAIIQNVLKLIYTLKKQAVNFMFIGNFECEENNVDNLNNLSLDDTYIVNIAFGNRQRSKRCKIIVSNKRCNINGYNEKWLMNCSQCKNKSYI